jgi:hypothetical protein
VLAAVVVIGVGAPVTVLVVELSAKVGFVVVTGALTTGLCDVCVATPPTVVVPVFVTVAALVLFDATVSVPPAVVCVPGATPEATVLATVVLVGVTM